MGLKRRFRGSADSHRTRLFDATRGWRRVATKSAVLFAVCTLGSAMLSSKQPNASRYPSDFAVPVSEARSGRTCHACEARAARAEATVEALVSRINNRIADLDLRQHLLVPIHDANGKVKSRVGEKAVGNSILHHRVSDLDGQAPQASEPEPRRRRTETGQGCSNNTSCLMCSGGHGACPATSSCTAALLRACNVMVESFSPAFAYAGLNATACAERVLCIDCSGPDSALVSEVPCPPEGFTGDNTSRIVLLLDNTVGVNLTGTFGRSFAPELRPYPQYLASISFANATVNGMQLDFSGMTFGANVNFQRAFITPGVVSASFQHTRIYGDLDLSDTIIPAGISSFALQSVSISGDLLLTRAALGDGLSNFAFREAGIGGNVDMAGVRLSRGIGGSAFMASHIAGDFNLSGAVIDGGIVGEAFLNMALSGVFDMRGTNISGGIQEGAFLVCEFGAGFTMARANIEGGISTGAFRDAVVNGDLDLSRVNVTNGSISAFAFQRVTIRSDLSLHGASVPEGLGNFSFAGTSIYGSVDLSGADLRAGISLFAFATSITYGDFKLVGTDLSAGGLEPGSMLGATVGGFFNASGALFPNKTLPIQMLYGLNVQKGLDFRGCGIETLQTRPCSEGGCVSRLEHFFQARARPTVGTLEGGPFTGASMPVGIVDVLVDLSDNRLTEISRTSLLGITATEVDLSNNPSLAVFSPRWFLGIPNVQTITTAGNPTTCTRVGTESADGGDATDTLIGNYTFDETSGMACVCGDNTAGTGTFCARDPCSVSLAALNRYAAQAMGGGVFSPGTTSVSSGESVALSCPHGTRPAKPTVEAQCLGGAFPLQTNQCIAKKLSSGEIAAIVLGVLALAALAGYFLLLSPERRKRRDLSYTLIDTKKQTELNERLLEETKGDLEEATALNSRMRGAWKIEEADVEIGPVLASGAFGVVHSGTFGGLQVAVKVLKRPLDEELDPDLGREFARECETLMAARHASLLIFYGAGLTAESRPFMVTEFMARGSLRGVLQNTQVDLNWGVRQRVALQIARAMEYLHGVGIVHRDLKSDNCLLNDQLNAKVCDFGTSKFVTLSRPKFQETSLGTLEDQRSEAFTATMTKGVGTILWMAPELFWGGAKYGPEVDVYSYGVILWELLTRERPWNHLRETEYILFFAALSNALQAGERPELSQDLADAHPDFVAVMQRCWVTDPATRPTFKAVVDALASD